MDWKNTKFLLASTATLMVASHLVKKVCNYFSTAKKKPENDLESNDACSDVISFKNREINDVILFTDEVMKTTIKVPLTKNVCLRESRELNCFKLFKYIKSARETLDVCMYLITSAEIAEQIIRLGQKHVLVRIIVDNEMAFTPPSQIKRLMEYSFIQIQKSKKSILMHHKFCIIDGPKSTKRKNALKAYAEKLNVHAQIPKHTDKIIKPRVVRGFVMAGSLNWSTQAMISNHESVIVTSNSKILSHFEKEFESLWVEDEPMFKKIPEFTILSYNNDKLFVVSKNMAISVYKKFKT